MQEPQKLQHRSSPLTKRVINRLIRRGDIEYINDKDGNVLSERGLRYEAWYEYNGQNRMTHSETTSHADRTHAVSFYAYDALGRRTLTESITGQVLRTVYDGRSFEVIREGETFRNGNLTTQFATSEGVRAGTFMQSNQPTGERYRWISDDYNGGNISADGYSMESSRYGTRGVTLYGNGEAVAVSYSSSTSSRSVYLGKDILGSVRTATTDGGAVEDRYEYDAFGQAYKGDLSGGMNLGYTGKPYDARTGLYNYGYRDYRPQAARFTTADPIRDGNNWYAYVNNDPVNYIDLWGLDACSSVDKLKTQPIRGEERLPDGLINELVRYRGWTDISRDEEARNEAAMDLKQKCFDEEYQDNWFVGYISTTWDYKGTSYHGEHYLVYQYDPETGQFAPPVPVREYWDIDGNGRIDFSR